MEGVWETEAPFCKVTIWLEKLCICPQRGFQEEMLGVAGGESWSIQEHVMGHPPMRIMGRFFIWEILNMPACCCFFLPTAAPMILNSSSSEAPARR